MLLVEEAASLNTPSPLQLRIGAACCLIFHGAEAFEAAEAAETFEAVEAVEVAEGAVNVNFCSSILQPRDSETQYFNNHAFFFNILYIFRQHDIAILEITR
ncbi:MAG: hypothetical protein AB9903_07630 [Vulcanimicrobiota bacterium]